MNTLIYTNKVARASETFIYFPALKMKRYTPHFVGSLKGDAFDLPADRVHIANGRGRFARIRQRLFTQILGHNGVPFLANELRSLKPCLIQSHFGPESIHAIPLAERLSIPLIVYYHGFDATFTPEYAQTKPFLQRYLKQLPRLQEKANLVLTQSDFLRDKVLELGYSPEKVRTHYIGVEPAKEPPLPLSERKPMVLFVARMVEKKGATYLIKAMQIVQEQHPELELVMVGNGEEFDVLYHQAREQVKNFRFTGWQSHDVVYQWMKEALIFCVPSVTASTGDSEGFGMVFIEAQRVGTPVVSTLHGGIVESVANNETGLLVPERNSEALAESIMKLYGDKQLWKQFSQYGYERVRQEFNINRLVEKLELIYDEVCSDWDKWFDR